MSRCDSPENRGGTGSGFIEVIQQVGEARRNTKRISVHYRSRFPGPFSKLPDSACERRWTSVKSTLRHIGKVLPSVRHARSMGGVPWSGTRYLANDDAAFDDVANRSRLHWVAMTGMASCSFDIASSSECASVTSTTYSVHNQPRTKHTSNDLKRPHP